MNRRLQFVSGILATLIVLQWRIVDVSGSDMSNGDDRDGNGQSAPQPIPDNGHGGRSRTQGYLSGPNVCGRGDSSHCCPGWRRRDDGSGVGQCIQPICTRSCGVGGLCVRPNTCFCISERTIAPCGAAGAGSNGNGGRRPPSGIVHPLDPIDPVDPRDPRSRVSCREPCLNGGRCIGNDRCACVYGYSGRRCERDHRTGPCFRRVQNQFCAGQLSGVVCTRQLCCATIGTAWGHPCEHCPSQDKMNCQRGYITNVHSKSCQDVDECEAIPGLCDGGTCTNSPGSFRCTCKDGYTWDEDHCKNENECEARQEICFNGRCVDTEGSFYCICEQGYVPSHDRKACIDVRQGTCYTRYNPHGRDRDRCLDRLPVRLSQMECCCGKDMGQAWDGSSNGRSNSASTCQPCPQLGSQDYQRLCVPGSSLEINECELRPGICENGKCINTPDSYRCECLPGYVFSNTEKKCVDVDECSNGTLCRKGGGRCFNTVGSFKCLCPKGYDVSPDGTECTDRNECSASGTCANGECTNGAGSYTCRCKPGYTLSPTGRACVDLDECAENVRICLRGRCQNTPGSYRCLCDEGYAPAPSAGGQESGFCIDRNECDEGNVCLNGKCINQDGGFKCVCSSGYKISTNGRFCIDVNECLETPNVCANGRCENQEGSFRCVCGNGFSLGPGGRGCLDTRKDFCYAVFKTNGECTEPSSSHLVTRSTCCCAAHAGGTASHFGWGTPCAPCPLPGSSQFDQLCSHDSGAGINGEDINECKIFPNICPNGACENLQGSFRCVCNPGYQIDITGKVCTDINECAINLLLCEHGQCRNTPGSYQCTCPLGYRLNAHTNACEDIDECREPQTQPDGKHLPRRPSTSGLPGVCVGGTCTNTPGSYKCECEPGSVLDATRSICIDDRKGSCWLKLSADGVCEDHVKKPMLKSECCSTVGKAWGSPCQPCVDQKCPRGFTTTDGVNCVDVNECEVFSNLCKGGGLCLNTEGSFRCNCPPGLTLDSKTGTNCIDYREETCFRRYEKRQCSRPLDGFFKKSTCCCSMVGEAWGRSPCQPCPSPQSDAFKELCPKEGFTFEGLTDEDYGDIFDIDECNRFVDICQNGRCQNSVGGFSCTCYKGFDLDPDGINCTDIDECSIMHGGMCANGICRNILGSFACDCNEGFEPVMMNQMCNDIDECAQNRFLCRGGSCVNTPGSFVCDCPIGHELSEDGRYCKDIDECDVKSSVCSNGVCENMMGAFWCSCNEGFTPTLPQQTSCEDVDECTINRDNGRCQYQCVNSPGGYHCVCQEGYELTPDGFGCKDVEECSENPSICGGGKCTNVAGSYTCDCGDGLIASPDGKNCIDIDECLLNPNLCMNGRCENTEGSFACRCDFGYSVKEDGQGCTDDDECELAMSDCDENAECVNTPGSYKCDCRDGFTGDGVSCRDVNECSRNHGGCHMDSICINGDGSYRCVCDDGLRGDGFSCTDIDECAEGGVDICEHGQCINYPGGYDCECDQGFAVQTSRSCTDIDECSSFDKICMFGRCENAFGMFRCLCNVGYQLDESGGNCTDTNECENPQACQYGTCINTQGSYICQCPVSHQLIESGTGCVDKRDGLCYAKSFGNYNGKGNCLRQDAIGDVVTKATCCCTVGEAWGGGHCEICPAAGSSEYEQLCPSGPGFRPNILSVTLEDVNECDEYPHGTICTGGGKCANTFGSFMCSCPAGFSLDETERNCVDENECDTRPGLCGTGSCSNTDGGYLCNCPEGFVAVPGGTCVDMRTAACYIQYKKGVCSSKMMSDITKNVCCCSVGRAWGDPCEPCPINGTDEYVKYCSQAPGTVQDPITGGVIDVDECQGMVCQNGMCINTLGSFDCQCHKGFVYNPILLNCEDVNECQQGGYGPCTGSALCVNIPGGFECRCSDGYKLSPSGRDCQDLDECLEKPNICQNGRCSNLEGSFRCTCNPGFNLTPLGDQCIDIDECSRNLACSNNGDCVNSPGSFKCFCHPGFKLQGASECVDVDECRVQFGVCQNGRCRNTVGSFECQCQPGYRLSSDGKSCLDVNECIEEPDMCRLGTCRNSDGSFQCTCLQGYMNTPDKRECTDVDECAPQGRPRPGVLEEEIKCFGGRCINKDGSFECQCAPGFKLSSDRQDCIDERRGSCFARYEAGRCLDPKHSLDVGRTECCCMAGSKAWGGANGVPPCQPCPPPNDAEFKLLCKAGPGYITNGKITQDINECEMDPTLCPNGECINTDGSYRCQCRPGFQLHGENCVDVDECRKPFICGHNSTCRNIDGSFECSCPAGYAPGSKKSCEDINECREMGHMCAFRCQNIPGSFQCTCPHGFKLALDGKHCEDLDECASGLARECRYACKNLVGNYMCVCPTGYEKVGPMGDECRDVDECRGYPRPCKNGRCTNTKGGYRCDCYDGYEASADGKECLDVRIGNCFQSVIRAGQCPSGRTSASVTRAACCCGMGVAWGDRCETCPRKGTADYSELCPHGIGFDNDGKDVDECLTMKGMCVNSRCINTMGSYRCICNKGFEHPPDGSQIRCQDIDECSRPGFGGREQGPCDQECRNSEGSFKCSCRKGFRLEVDGLSCTDIDECSIGRHDCQHKCVNIPGSFECGCRTGYEKSSRSGCLDVDECSKDPGICAPLGTCKNTPGSYRCICPRGYATDADGTSCYDTDECELDGSKCDLGCENLPGSYRCTCPEGKSPHYYWNNCVDDNECSSNPSVCGSADCTNTVGSYSCNCQAGLTFDPTLMTCIDMLGAGGGYGGCQPNLCAFGCTPVNSNSWACGCPDGYQRIGPDHCLSTISPSPGEVNSLNNQGGNINMLTNGGQGVGGLGDGYSEPNDNIISTEGCYSCNLNSHTNSRVRNSRSAGNESSANKRFPLLERGKNATKTLPKNRRKSLGRVSITSPYRRTRHSRGDQRNAKDAKVNPILEAKHKMSKNGTQQGGVNLRIPVSLTHPDVRILQLQPATNQWRHKIIYQIIPGEKGPNIPCEMIESRGIYILHFTKEQNQPGQFQFKISAFSHDKEDMLDTRTSENSFETVPPKPLFTLPVTLSVTK